ncbi:MAG TPA: hypothetical protein VHM19_10000, partial [Polyangiales bacterium]|nr:hypothetical protein [Polyangiales bacterium]
PNASFARTMAELSPSMPPGKLADSLPANPPSNSPSTNPRKITLDGTEKPVKPPLRPNTMKVDPRATTLDGTQVPVRPKPQTSSQPQQPQQVDARKTTLDGKEKPVRAPARPSSGPVSATVANPASKSDKPTSDKPGKPTSDKPVAGKSSSDPARVKNIVTHFAHKRYAMGLKECAELLQADANDSQALKWQAMCKARVALGEGDEDGAAQHYEKALEHDEQIREARDFVRTYHRDKRLASLPFGRYFTKKK